MGELLSVCCGKRPNTSQTHGGHHGHRSGDGGNDLYNIRDPAYVTDTHPGGCDGDCGGGDRGDGGGDEGRGVAAPLLAGEVVVGEMLAVCQAAVQMQ